MKSLSKCKEIMINTTGNLLDFSYDQSYYKLFGIDLSKQKIQFLLKKLILQEN